MARHEGENAEQAARTELVEMERRGPLNMFCPMRNAPCHRECVCVAKPSVYKISKTGDIWDTYDWMCNNGSLIGGAQ